MLLDLLEKLIQFIFPNHCLQCQVQTLELFCHDCLEKIFFPRVRIFKHKEIGLKVFSALRYQTGVQKLIKSKFVDKPQVFQQAGQLLAKATCATNSIAQWSEYIFVPVPCHWTRMATRGFNQCQILAQAICKKMEYSYCNLLTKTKATDSQASTNKKIQRLANVKNCFQINQRELSKLLEKQQKKSIKVVIVDDLVTSGATLLQCARVLKECFGECEILGLTLSSKDL